MIHRRAVRAAVTAAVLGTAAVTTAGCSAGDDAPERAASAAEAAASWSDPAVQQRWSTAVVVRSPVVDPSQNLPVSKALASLRQGLATIAGRVGDDSVPAVVDYPTAADLKVRTIGAQQTLRGLAVEPVSDTCWNGGPCARVEVTAARLSTMLAPTARGMASLPAWEYTVEGLGEPVVLPAVRTTDASEVNPDRPGESLSELMARDGKTLRVLLFLPYCGHGSPRPHLLERSGVVVVWSSGTPAEVECAAPMRAETTFTLQAPVGDRPVVDEEGNLLMPRRVLLPPRH